MAKRTRKKLVPTVAPRTSERVDGPFMTLRAWIPVILVMVAGALLLAWFTAGPGLGISPDSVSYLSAAQSLVHGRGLLDFDGGTFSSWPPLLPMLLSIPTFLGARAVQVAYGAQLLLYAACLGWILAWGYRMRLPRPVLWALVASCLLVFAPLRVAAMLWSELPYTALVLFTLERLVRWERTPSESMGVAAALGAALAVMTRYAGLGLVFSGVVFLLASRRYGRRRALARAAFFGSLGVLPLALWVLRNLLQGQGPLGPRAPAMLSLRQVLDYLGTPLPGLYLPESWGTALPAVIWLLLFVLVWIALFTWAGSRRGSSSKSTATDSAYLLLLFVGVSVCLLAAAIGRTAMDRPNLRLLAPTVWPTLLAVAALGAGATVPAKRGESAPAPTRRETWIRWTTAGALVLVALLGAIQLPSQRAWFHEAGAGLALPHWQQSALARRIGQLDRNMPLITNRPDAVFYLCGIRAHWAPREKSHGSHDYEIQTRELRRFERLVRSQGPRSGALLAWFDRTQSFLLELDTLRTIYQVQMQSERLADGELIFVPYFEGSAVVE